MKPFRFLADAYELTNARALGELARKAEDLGATTFVLPDHLIQEQFSPVPFLAAIAALTERLRLSAFVHNNDLRHPAVLAQDLASLDVLSGGRLDVAIGAGWNEPEYRAIGLRFDPVPVRQARLAEAITVLKGCFGDGPFSFAGEHYTITDYDAAPKPVQQPHPPFIIGGGGPKVLAVAAREAAIVGLNANLRGGVAISDDAARSMTGAATDEKVARLRVAAGDRFDDLELQSFVGFTNFTDDRRSLAEMMAGAFGVAPEEALETPVVLAGTLEEMIDDVLARRERWGMSYVVVGVDVMEQFAPAVARLAGT
jgi:probable F420-dependent oxidoreductase